MGGFGIAKPIVSLSEAQAYVRIETGEEEAILAGLIRTASAVCESFLGQVVVARDVAADLPASAAWTQVPVSPMRSIASVELVDAKGASSPVPADGYAIDIDANGTGWARLVSTPGPGRMRVNGNAGMSVDQNGVPEPIRQGVLRLVAHLFAARDGGDGAPPAAVTALWRPYRRMRLS